MNKTENRPTFGPAGNSDDFFEAGNRSGLQAPEWIKKHGLDCYEYQCGHGVKISKDAAQQLGHAARKNNVLLSVHAPYYISLSSMEKEKRDRSVEYILQTLRAAKNMGADRIVVHSGSCGSITRREALALASDTLMRATEAAKAEELDGIFICPETMGKVNQLGNVEEVIKLCLLSPSFIPTMDFGHINAQTLGGLKTKSDYAAILDLMDKKLDKYRARNFHVHFSRIEYTNAGEKSIIR